MGARLCCIAVFRNGSVMILGHSMGVSRAHGLVESHWFLKPHVVYMGKEEMNYRFNYLQFSFHCTQQQKKKEIKKHWIIKGLRFAFQMETCKITEGTPRAHRTTSDLLYHFLLLDSGSKNGKRDLRFPY